MELRTVSELFELAEVVVSIRNADEEVTALLRRYESGTLAFEALMAELRRLSTVH
jgi:hypothetical protein